VSRPTKYRKKPVVVEAMRYVPGESCKDLARWLGVEHHEDACHPKASWDIQTLEGWITARPGDWIIKGVQGEFYPCKPDIFEQNYELAPPQPDTDKGER
jgi:hypothetical protein